MKDITIFYIALFIPMILLFAGVKLHWLSSATFVFGILFYALVYHPVISGIRLYQLGIINRDEIFKNLIPFWNRRYFKNLYFG